MTIKILKRTLAWYFEYTDLGWPLSGTINGIFKTSLLIADMSPIEIEVLTFIKSALNGVRTRDEILGGYPREKRGLVLEVLNKFTNIGKRTWLRFYNKSNSYHATGNCDSPPFQGTNYFIHAVSGDLTFFYDLTAEQEATWIARKAELMLNKQREADENDFGKFLKYVLGKR